MTREKEKKIHTIWATTFKVSINIDYLAVMQLTYKSSVACQDQEQ
jgi:hypothetical protein